MKVQQSIMDNGDMPNLSLESENQQFVFSTRRGKLNNDSDSLTRSSEAEMSGNFENYASACSVKELNIKRDPCSPLTVDVQSQPASPTSVLSPLSSMNEFEFIIDGFAIQAFASLELLEKHVGESGGGPSSSGSQSQKHVTSGVRRSSCTSQSCSTDSSKSSCTPAVPRRARPVSPTEPASPGSSSSSQAYSKGSGKKLPPVPLQYSESDVPLSVTSAADETARAQAQAVANTKIGVVTSPAVCEPQLIKAEPVDVKPSLRPAGPASSAPLGSPVSTATVNTQTPKVLPPPAAGISGLGPSPSVSGALSSAAPKPSGVAAVITTPAAQAAPVTEKHARPLHKPSSSRPPERPTYPARTDYPPRPSSRPQSRPHRPSQAERRDSRDLSRVESGAAWEQNASKLLQPYDNPLWNSLKTLDSRRLSDPLPPLPGLPMFAPPLAPGAAAFPAFPGPPVSAAFPASAGLIRAHNFLEADLQRQMQARILGSSQPLLRPEVHVPGSQLPAVDSSKNKLESPFYKPLAGQSSGAFGGLHGSAPGAPPLASSGKKTGKWCAAHVTVAWRIHNHERRGKQEGVGEGKPAPHRPALYPSEPGYLAGASLSRSFAPAALGTPHDARLHWAREERERERESRARLTPSRSASELHERLREPPRPRSRSPLRPAERPELPDSRQLFRADNLLGPSGLPGDHAALGRVREAELMLERSRQLHALAGLPGAAPHQLESLLAAERARSELLQQQEAVIRARALEYNAAAAGLGGFPGRPDLMGLASRPHDPFLSAMGAAIRPDPLSVSVSRPELLSGLPGSDLLTAARPALLASAGKLLPPGGPPPLVPASMPARPLSPSAVLGKRPDVLNGDR